MNKLLFLFAISISCLVFSCDDDDSAESTPVCTGDELLNDCVERNLLGAEEYRTSLLGNWEHFSTDDLAQSGGCNLLNNQERYSFIYGADSSFVVTYADGSMETGTYKVESLCGSVPPCIVTVTYSDSISISPQISGFCENDGGVGNQSGALFYYKRR